MNHLPRQLTTTLRVLGLKIILILVPVVGFFVLLNHHLLISPTLTYSYRPGHTIRVISPTSLATLIQSADPILHWRLTTDTFPFQVTVPRAIEKIRVHGELQPGSQTLVYLSAAGAKGTQLRTLVSSTFLDTLAWKYVTDGTATLWMRDKRMTTEKKIEGTGKNKKEVTSTWEKDIKQYPSVSAFKSNPPDLNTVATLGFDRFALIAFSDAKPDEGAITLPQVFRGSHQFYVYATGTELKISFDKIDRNRKNDSDPLTVRVVRAEDISSRNQAWLKTIKVKDDGITGGSGPKGKPQPVEITLPTPRPGAYLVQIETSEDVLFTNLSSSARRLSFQGRVFIAEGPAYGEKDFRPLTLITNGSKLTFAPAHEQGKQDIFIAGKKYALKGVNVEVAVSGLKGITSTVINKPDIKITGDGLTTIAPAEIMPSVSPHPLDLSVPPNLDEIDYVLAEYQPRISKTITLDETYGWSELELKGKRFSFSLEMPGLKAADATLGMKELRATLIRGPIPWGKVWQKLGLMQKI